MDIRNRSCTIEEVIVNEASKLYLEGQKLNVVLLNRQDYQELVNGLGSQAWYIQVEHTGHKFDGVRLATAHGYVAVLPDLKIDGHKCYVIPVTKPYVSPESIFDTDSSLRGLR